MMFHVKHAVVDDPGFDGATAVATLVGGVLVLAATLSIITLGLIGKAVYAVGRRP